MAPYLPLVLGLAGYAAPILPAASSASVPGAKDFGTSVGSASVIAAGTFVDDLPAGEVPAEDAEHRMRVHAIDVGQGAATLFEFPCAAVLVDTGGETNGEFDSEDALLPYLDDFFARRTDLDYTLKLLVISHPHIDHARNVKRLTQEYRVENVVTDGLTRGSGGRQQKWLQDWAQQNAKLEKVKSEEVPQGGRTSSVIDPVTCTSVDPTIRVFWGALEQKPADWSQKEFENGNNHSVVMRVDFGKASFLMSGDLEVEGVDELLARHRPSLDVDVWQVSHHGSHNGVSQRLLNSVTPAIALFGTGPEERHASWTGWAYGHPRKAATDLILDSLSLARRPVDRLIATKAKVFESERVEKAAFATGWDGTIVVTATSEGRYSVVTER